MKIKLTHDLFNIIGRIKNIDSHYEIVFDTERVCFEIHNTRQAGNTFCLSVEGGSLDSRVVEKVYRTRSENAQDIFDLVDEHNRKLEEQKLITTKEETLDKVRECLYKK
ncbi:MAG: hypothetical protein J6C90_03380 [Clostridia bacterium]|nr:hypothetical protein [Clostridia bacterium]